MFTETLSSTWQLRYEIFGAMAGWHGTTVSSMLRVVCLLLIFGYTVGKNLHKSADNESCQPKRPPVVISKYALLSINKWLYMVSGLKNAFSFPGQQQRKCISLVVRNSHASLVFMTKQLAMDLLHATGGGWLLTIRVLVIWLHRKLHKPKTLCFYGCKWTTQPFLTSKSTFNQQLTWSIKLIHSCNVS